MGICVLNFGSLLDRLVLAISAFSIALNLVAREASNGLFIGNENPVDTLDCVGNLARKESSLTRSARDEPADYRAQFFTEIS